MEQLHWLEWSAGGMGVGGGVWLTQPDKNAAVFVNKGYSGFSTVTGNQVATAGNRILQKYGTLTESWYEVHGFHFGRTDFRRDRAVGIARSILRNRIPSSGGRNMDLALFTAPAAQRAQRDLSPHIKRVEFRTSFLKYGVVGRMVDCLRRRQIL